MKKDFLNICYKFFNRYITVNELISLLDNIDNKTRELESLIKKIKEVADSTLNIEDNFVKEKKKSIKEMIDRLGKDAKKIDFLKNSVKNLEKDYNKEIDSHDRWFKVFNVINDNDYFNKCFDSLTDYELLEFIAQNICAPFPPKLSQEEFDRLVKVGIEHSEKEWLWRLAFNYDDKGINFDRIVDYYIEVKDAYYLSELISAVGRSLDIDFIIDKITDQDIIKELLNNKSVISVYVNDEQFKKMESKLI